MPNSCVYAKILVNLKRKNSTFLTPQNFALNALNLALKDSAEAFSTSYFLSNLRLMYNSVL